MKDNRTPLSINSKVGTYRIGRVLGRGAFGITYLATSVESQDSFAIKEYYPAEYAVREKGTEITPFSNKRSEYFDGLKRFTSESRTLVSLSHKNIAKTVGYLSQNGTAYLIMIYYDGRTLRDSFETKKTLTESKVLELLVDLLDALGVVHQNGLIHGDLKPSNIFITLKDKPLLIDFGSSLRYTTRGDRGLRFVSDGYAAPEQYSGNVALGPWTDLYSAAAVAYRALTGIAPISADIRMYNDQLEPITSNKFKIKNIALANAIHNALSLRAADRPQSVESFKSLLLHSNRQKEVPLPLEIRSESRRKMQVEPSLLTVNKVAKMAILGALVLIAISIVPQVIKREHSQTIERGVGEQLNPLPLPLPSSQEQSIKYSSETLRQSTLDQGVTKQILYIKIQNLSQFPILSAYVSPSADGDIGTDRLPIDKVITSGSSFQVSVPKSVGCEYFVLVQYSSGEIEFKPKFNICNKNQISFDGSSRKYP